MQGVGQSVAWSQYLKYSGGKLLSQLCLEEPNPTRSGHLAVPPLLEDGEDGGGKIEDAKDVVHNCTIFLLPLDVRNIVQGGDPLYAVFFSTQGSGGYT